MKKRSIAIVLAILTLCTCIGFTNVGFAEKAECEDEVVELLNMLNIITKNEIEDFAPDKKITRAEFSMYIVRALSIGREDTGKDIFDDLKDSAFKGYINALYNRGIASGTNNNFNPDAYVSYNEAVKMIVCAAGYGNVAGELGAWPTGYIRVARDAQMLDDLRINDPSALTKSEGAHIIFNMLDAPVLEIKDIQNGTPIFIKNNDKSMLSDRYSIYKMKGTVLETPIVSLISGTSNLKAGEVRIGDVVYNVGMTEATSLVGCEIEFFYQYDEDNDESTILFINDRIKNDVLEIPSEDARFENGYYSYYEDGRVKKAKLSEDFSISYNFAYPSSGFTEAMMTPQTGKVTLIKTAKESEYSVVIIEDYQTYQVVGIDATRGEIYLSNGVTLSLEDYEHQIFSKEGTKKELSAIKQYDIVSLLYSADGKQLTVYFSNESVSGAVEGKHNEDGVWCFEIGGTEYKTVKDLSQANTITVKDNVTAYIDYMGRIGSIKKMRADGLSYGYIVKVIDDTDNEITKLKLFTQDGETVTKNLSEKVKINDESYKKKRDEAVTLLKNLSVKLCKYELGAGDEISKIYTVDSQNKYLREIFSGSAYWNSKQRGFGPTVSMDANATIFYIPSVGDVSDYTIGGLSGLQHDTNTSNIKVYTMGDNIYGEVIIRDSSAANSFERNAAVITNIRAGLNADDEIITLVDVFWGGTESSYELAKDDVLGDCQEGDIVQIARTTDLTKIAEIRRIYDTKNGVMIQSNPFEPQTGAAHRSANRAYFGYVYVAEDGVMRFSKTEPTRDNLNAALLDPASYNLENALIDAFNVCVVDMNAVNSIARGGSASDIIDFKSGGGSRSKVLVATAWFDPADIFVIK